MIPYQKHVFVCTNRRPDDDPRGSCGQKGGEELREAFKVALRRRGVAKRIRANASGCLDQCANGCTVVVYPDAVWYGRVRLEDVEEIVDEHLLGGEPVERLRIDRRKSRDGEQKGSGEG